jgi:hypothetical protein
MRKLTLASLLALSISVLPASEASAFSTKSLFNKLDPTEAVDNTDLAPFLNATLNVQASAPAASQSVEPTLVNSAISVQPQAAGFLNLSEGFNSVSSLSSNGWVFQNNSSPAPLSPANWTQGDTTTSNFGAQSGPANSYAQVDFGSISGDGPGMVSNWLITPELDFSAGGAVSFFARTFGGNDRAELIELRLSNAGSSTNVGSLATDLGDFTTLVGSAGGLNSISNSPGALSGTSWIKYSFNIAPKAGSGRLAFRYFATNGGGLDSANSQAVYAAIDTVNYLATGAPEPAVSSLAGFAALGLASYFKGKRKRSIS